MADISIDSTIGLGSARGQRSVVFTTADIGYWFFVDGTTDRFSYRKTTDGGATWAAAVELATTTTLAYDVWYDKWTPGDNGTLIHLFHCTSGDDDTFWQSLDTSSDTLGTRRTVFAGATFVAGRGVFVSGTKARDGTLYCAYDGDAGAEKGLHRSTDSGTTWSSNLATTFVEATLDEALLFPASNTGDNRDIWAIYLDTSATAITLKMWDSSAAAEVESTTIAAFTPNATDQTGQFGYSGSIRHSDGHLIVAICTERDTATADHRVFDLNGTGSITEKTAITTNIDDHYYPAMFIDQTTDKLFVAFNGLRTGADTLGTTSKVYYTSSTDGGANWSAGSTAYMEGAAGVVVQVWAPLMGPRFFAGWRVGSTLVGNKVNSVTFATAYNLVIDTASYAISGVAASLLLGHVLAVASGSYAITGTDVGTFKGSAVSIASGAYAITGTDATLVYTPASNHLLAIDPGSYAITGTALSPLLGRRLTVDTAVYTITGTAVGLLANHKVPIGAGSYSQTGTAANVLLGRAVSVGAGSYSITGQDAQLIHTPVNNHILAVVGGSYALSGTDVAVLRGYIVSVGAGSYVVTGTIANLFAGSVPPAILVHFLTVSLPCSSHFATVSMPGHHGASVMDGYSMANGNESMGGLANGTKSLAMAPVGS